MKDIEVGPLPPLVEEYRAVLLQELALAYVMPPWALRDPTLSEQHRRRTAEAVAPIVAELVRIEMLYVRPLLFKMTEARLTFLA